jgi:ABC-type branched-subunit amino acid transport system ATPase component
VKELFRVDRLCRSFGGLMAVRNLSFDIREGEILGMIGPNGSGKTTVFNVITGIYRPTSGSLHFDGHPIGGRPSYAVTRLGINRSFQNIRLFQNMSTMDNILVGRHLRIRPTFLVGLFRGGRVAGEKPHRALALELLKFTGLAGKEHELASNLSYGEQRRLELARALANEPRLLLLDEPTAGMNPREAAAMIGIIRSIRDTGVTILLVEHNMKVLMGVSDRVIVLDAGEKIAEGSPREVQRNSEVIRAYLGTE